MRYCKNGDGRPARKNDTRCHRCASPTRYGKAAAAEVGAVSLSTARTAQKRRYRGACAGRIARGICEFCGTQNLIPAQLHVDHVNGAHDDDRPENWQVLCANCHILKGIAAGDYNGHKNRAR